MTNTSRRKIIQTAGGLAIIGTAGCLGDDDPDDPTPTPDDPDDPDDPTPTPDDPDEYPDPDRTISAVVPFSAGGGYDWYTRTLAEFVSNHLPNQPTVVVENVTGAGGLVATNQMWHAEPDGYRYMMRHGLSSVAQQIGLPDQADFDVREFTNLGLPAISRYGFIRNPRTTDPIDDWDELVEVVTTERIGTGGVGDAPHLFAIMAGNITGSWTADDLDFVHYEGFGDSMAAMDRNEIELTIAGLGSAPPYIDDGVTEAVVAFTVDAPEEFWPGTPSVVDWDAPGAEEMASSLVAPRIWTSPPGVPEDRAEILAQALYDATTDPEFLELAEEGGRPVEVADAAEAQQITESMYNAMIAEEELFREIMQ